MTPSAGALGGRMEETVLNTPLPFWRSLVCDRLRDTLGGFLGSPPSSLDEFVCYLYGLGQTGPSHKAWSDLFEACHSASIVSSEYVASLLVYAANTHVLTAAKGSADNTASKGEAAVHSSFVQNTLRPALFGSDASPELPGILCVVRRMWNEWMYGPQTLRNRVYSAVAGAICGWSVVAHVSLGSPDEVPCRYVWTQDAADDAADSLCSSVSSWDGEDENRSSVDSHVDVCSATSATAAVTTIGTRVAVQEVARVLAAHAAAGISHSAEIQLELLEFAKSRAAALLCDKMWSCRSVRAPSPRSPPRFEGDTTVSRR